MANDLSDLTCPELPEMAEVRKFLVLILWQAQEDEAEELVIGEPNLQQVQIRYRVDGHGYEMAPIPEEIRDAVHQVGIEMAGHSGPAQFPWQGKIDLDVLAGLHLSWSVELPAKGGSLYFRRPKDE